MAVLPSQGSPYGMSSVFHPHLAANQVPSLAVSYCLCSPVHPQWGKVEEYMMQVVQTVVIPKHNTNCVLTLHPPKQIFF